MSVHMAIFVTKSRAYFLPHFILIFIYLFVLPFHNNKHCDKNEYEMTDVHKNQHKVAQK